MMELRPALVRMLLLALLLAVATAACGSEPGIVAIPDPDPAAAGIVYEFFSFSCPACARFSPLEQKLRASLPQDVTLVRVPVIFHKEWQPAAQAFHAALALGFESRVHDDVFSVVQKDSHLSSSLTATPWAEALERLSGMSAASIYSAMTGPQTLAELNADYQLATRYRVAHTPTFVVRGQWKVEPGVGISDADAVSAVVRLAKGH